MRPLGIGHARGPVDLELDDPSPGQRRVEAIAGMGEVGVDSRRPQPRVDAREQQTQIGPEQIIDLPATEGLQLGAREPHDVILPNPSMVNAPSEQHEVPQLDASSQLATCG